MANISTISYNGAVIAETEEPGDIAVQYEGRTIANITAGETKSLLCNGKVMKTNLYIGAKTLLCEMAQMISDVIVAVKSAFPAEPTAYSLIGTYTASQTWTAPEDGYYQIENFGASGKGASGHSWGESVGQFYVSVYVGGGGGGGGGYACSRIKMKKGDTASIVIGAVGATTSVTINSSIETYSAMQVTSGVNGAQGGKSTNSPVGGIGGAGGVGSGGNYANATGGTGGNGKWSSYSGSWGGEGDYRAPGGAGGAAGYAGGNIGGSGGQGYELGVGANGSAGFIKIYRGNTNVA